MSFADRLLAAVNAAGTGHKPATAAPAPASTIAVKEQTSADFDRAKAQLLNRHQVEGTLQWASPHSPYGCANVFAVIKERVTLAKPAVDALQTIRREEKRLWIDLDRIASQTAGQLHEAHLRELGQKIIEGLPLESADGFGLDELASDRRTKIAAIKLVLKENSLKAHAIAKTEILAPALSEAEQLLDAELRWELDRAKRYGVQEPLSNILHAIAASHAVLLARMDSPQRYASVDDLTLNLLDE